MIKIVITVFIALLFCVQLPAQQPKKEELLKKQQVIKEDISNLNNELNDVRKRKRSRLSELSLLEKKIILREQAMKNNKQQVALMDTGIYHLEREITRLNDDLKLLKSQFAKSVVYAYKAKSNYDFLNFIFSAANFNDALKRVEYLKSYRFYREQQAEAIQTNAVLLQDKIKTLQVNRVEKGKTFDDQQKELLLLAVEKKEKNDLVTTLKTKENELAKEITKKAKTDKELQKGIEAAIARGTKRKPVVKTKKEPANTVAGKEEKSITNDFDNARGSLPWPVVNPSIKLRFGKYVIPNTHIENYNPGLTLETDAAAPVKAVFEGEVTAVFDVEENMAVIVSYGNYAVTYGNLASVLVSKGQKITAGQVLGKAANNSIGNGEIEFVIIVKQDNQRSKNIDPEPWLKKK